MVLPADQQEENHLLQQPTEQETLLGPTSQQKKTVKEIRSNFLQMMKNYFGWVYVLLYPLFFYRM